MDAKQISELSNYSIISLLLLIFRELAKRLEVPLVPLPNKAAQGSQDKEMGCIVVKVKRHTLAGTAVELRVATSGVSWKVTTPPTAVFSTVGIK